MLALLSQLTTQRLHDLITSPFKGGCISFGKQISPGNMDLDFRYFIAFLVVFVEAEEYLTRNQMVVKGCQLLHLGVNESQELLVGIEMNGVNLYLHDAEIKVPHRAFGPMGYLDETL